MVQYKESLSPIGDETLLSVNHGISMASTDTITVSSSSSSTCGTHVNVEEEHQLFLTKNKRRRYVDEDDCYDASEYGSDDYDTESSDDTFTRVPVTWDNIRDNVYSMHLDDDLFSLGGRVYNMNDRIRRFDNVPNKYQIWRNKAIKLYETYIQRAVLYQILGERGHDLLNPANRTFVGGKRPPVPWIQDIETSVTILPKYVSYYSNKMSKFNHVWFEGNKMIFDHAHVWLRANSKVIHFEAFMKMMRDMVTRGHVMQSETSATTCRV